MGLLTGALYACLIVYLGGWYLGEWHGNFSLLLFILTIVTFGYWLAERLRFAPARRRAVEALESQHASRQAELARRGIAPVEDNLEDTRNRLLMQPWWLDWTAGLFPVICLVFLLRSFLYEPFKIPSGSMVPTLLVGDLILVNKYHYGVRLPVINKKIIDVNTPERGDVMVFRYPLDTRVDYIKRVVGLPGDEVAYRNKRLFINGQPVETVPLGEYYDEDGARYRQQFKEKLGAVEHRFLNNKEEPPFVMAAADFPYKENCRYTAEGVTCKVPAGHYFMMGDNRDNSQDSRAWGFVPDENIVGKAFLIWMNLGNLGRIGSFQ
ncbi:signal peptidase I [Aquabacterium sp. A7-Y]|uniref:signal peptidase I n=1 Tax=Aquabacterium sp. A7-Y TaxID=1349605 RepID=UPI00223D5A01|nr:signal peptidase I [Aquabacterium sp. A7-Y]MCW7541808.1 signal peptidase I [Aquabacterium sp. A7-Y]